MTTCERIDNILKTRNMSRRKLAIQAGIAPSSLQSAMERNGNLSLDMLFPISDVLGMSVRYLSDGEEDWNPSQEELDDMERHFLNAPHENGAKSRAHLLTVIALEKLNDHGCAKVARYAKDLSEIPRYRRQESPQPPPPPAEGADTTPPSDGSEGSQEGGETG